MTKVDPLPAPATPPVSFLQYDRTVIAFHGTDRGTADRLVNGEPFAQSEREDEWLGTGVYFWEHAPKQAWRWATAVRRHKLPAVVGAVVRLGNCFDLCDPGNVALLVLFKNEMVVSLHDAGRPVPKNHRRHMKLDCAVFNHVYNRSERRGQPVDSFRAVYVPVDNQKRVWKGSWIYAETHIQVCVRAAANIVAVWHVRRDGHYGVDS